MLIDSLAIMLAIVIPTICATLAFAWWFRASNARATYRPKFSYSGQLEMVVWAVPAMVVLLLSGVVWVGTHQLDPPRPIESATPALHVDVVSLDWKWLFIYPDLGVASVNRLVVPVGTPIAFRLTSATVMNSFFVPQLGSQIYSMAGMVTRLNLRADQPGIYRGMSAQISGEGFSDMLFDVVARPPAEFQTWLADLRAGRGPALDATAYAELAKPSTAVRPVDYRAVMPGLFDSVMSLSADPAASGTAPGHGSMPMPMTLPTSMPMSTPMSASMPMPMPMPNSLPMHPMPASAANRR